MNIYSNVVHENGRRVGILSLPKQVLRTFAALLLLLAASIRPLPAQNIQITIHPDKKELGELLPEISRQTGAEFSYDLEVLKIRTLATGKVSGTLNQVLDRIFDRTGVSYTLLGANRIALTYTAPTPAQPQASKPGSYRLTGVVRDQAGKPLAGVTVVENPYNGTATGTDGSYALEVKPEAQIAFSCLGYAQVVESVAGRTTLDVTLQEEATALEELVVVGYRTVKKLSLTGSVATVDIKSKEHQPITNSTQMLYNTPGIWVNQGGAQPGVDKASISIRGVNSLNSTGGAPLVLLDGVEYDFGEIDPSTIESITVLKDVSAAIYGLKAANGVILVTSKKGSKGRPRVEYSGKYGIQRATYLPDVVTDPILYMRLRNLAEINSGVSPGAVSYSNAQILEYMEGMKTDPSVYPASDWFDICMDDGYVQQHSVRLSGGTDAITYSMGVGYTDQKGVFIENDNAQRYSFDLKLNARVSDALNISGTFQGNLRTFN